MTAPNTEQNLLDEKTSTGISANQEKDINTKPQKADIANATSLVSALQPNTNTHPNNPVSISANASASTKHNNKNPIVLSLDRFGRLDALTLPQGSTYTRQYDDFGRLITHTDANTGTHSHIIYDPRCPYCHEFFEDSRHLNLKDKNITLKWLPCQAHYVGYGQFTSGNHRRLS